MRILFVAVALACVIATAAAGASVAAAALPEFAECQTVKGTGAFKDSACSTPDPTHKSNHEIGAPTGTAFTGKHRGGAVLKLQEWTISGDGSLECSGATDEGRVASATEVQGLRFLFTGCKGPYMPFAECKQVGRETPLGTIEFGPIDTTLAYINASEHRVGIDLTPAGGFFAEAECGGGFSLRLGGSDVAELSGEELEAFSKHFELRLSAAERLEGGPLDTPSWEIMDGATFHEWTPPKPVSTETPFTNTAGAKLKIER